MTTQKLTEEFMQRAIDLSTQNVHNGGGPFGAVIVQNGKIIAEGTNTVTLGCDPTNHAEINAIHEACKILKKFDLSGCEIYSSCEPCPMCLSALYWAHIDKIYYANTAENAAKINFDDKFIYDELNLPKEKRKIPQIKIMSEKAIETFNIWQNKKDKVEY